MEVSPEIQEIIDEEVDRLPNRDALAVANTKGMTILEIRNGDLRWESDRFHREDVKTEALERKADRFLAHMENEDEC